MSYQSREAIDSTDPRAAAEARELEEMVPHPSRSPEEVAAFHRRVIAWCLEGGSLARNGFRLQIAAAKLQIDPTAPTLHAIAVRAGFGRSAANRHAMDFTRTFDVRGPHDRTPETCQTYSESWKRRDAARQPIPA